MTEKGSFEGPRGFAKAYGSRVPFGPAVWAEAPPASRAARVLARVKEYAEVFSWQLKRFYVKASYELFETLIEWRLRTGAWLSMRDKGTSRWQYAW